MRGQQENTAREESGDREKIAAQHGKGPNPGMGHIRR
jgi:hypothetical protein